MAIPREGKFGKEHDADGISYHGTAVGITNSPNRPLTLELVVVDTPGQPVFVSGFAPPATTRQQPRPTTRLPHYTAAAPSNYTIAALHGSSPPHYTTAALLRACLAALIACIDLRW